MVRHHQADVFARQFTRSRHTDAGRRRSGRRSLTKKTRRRRGRLVLVTHTGYRRSRAAADVTSPRGTRSTLSPAKLYHTACLNRRRSSKTPGCVERFKTLSLRRRHRVRHPSKTALASDTDLGISIVVKMCLSAASILGLSSLLCSTLFNGNKFMQWNSFNDEFIDLTSAPSVRRYSSFSTSHYCTSYQK